MDFDLGAHQLYGAAQRCCEWVFLVRKTLFESVTWAISERSGTEAVCWRGGLLVVPVIQEIKKCPQFVLFQLVTTFFLATALRMLSTVSLRTLLLVVRSLSSTPEPKLLVWL